MQPEEIIDKLRPMLLQQGMEIDYLGLEGAMVNVRAKRVSPGPPVAFLLKGIAGTFRRYMPEVEDVCLVEYDPGNGITTTKTEMFEPVFNHRPTAVSIPLAGLPVVDLKGLSRRDAVRAIEGFFKVWGPRSPVVGLQGLTDEAALRAARKWAEVYRDDYREAVEVDSDRWEFVVDGENPERISELKTLGDEVMPGRIFLTNEESAT